MGPVYAMCTAALPSSWGASLMHRQGSCLTASVKGCTSHGRLNCSFRCPPMSAVVVRSSHRVILFILAHKRQLKFVLAHGQKSANWAAGDLSWST